MGTSSDYKGGSGGAWRPFKVATTNYAKRGGETNARRVVARHVAALGGVGGAAGSAATGIVGAQRFAGLLSGIAQGGLSQALRDAGLGDLVGRDRFEIVRALVDAIAGAGGDLEGQAARAAALDVIDELFGDGDEYADLEALTLDAAGVLAALEAFLAYYLYNRMLPMIDERLTRFADPQRAEQLDEDLRQLIRAQVRIRLRDLDPLAIDWGSADGRRIIDGLLRGAYQALEDLEE